MIRQMYKAAEFVTSNAAAMVQQAGIVALRDGESYLDELRRHYSARRAQVIEALAAVPRVLLPEPEGAFYAFPQIEGLQDSAGFTARLVRETGVAFTPGVAFGQAGEGYIRICFAASETTVTEAMARFAEFMTRMADPEI
jgi:aspartate/methionine/tyrosine aminotransferase